MKRSCTLDLSIKATRRIRIKKGHKYTFFIRNESPKDLVMGRGWHEHLIDRREAFIYEYPPQGKTSKHLCYITFEFKYLWGGEQDLKGTVIIDWISDEED